MKHFFLELYTLSFVLMGIMLTVFCWGTYGSVLHKGQAGLGGDRLKPLVCVGVAYLFVAILVPMIVLVLQGRAGTGWTASGVLWSLGGGACGALGALGIVFALTSGGRPVYVMPLVFGGAPIINVLVSMYFERIPLNKLNPIFLAGIFMVVLGAALVLIFKPAPPPSHAQKPAAVKREQANVDGPEKAKAEKRDQGVNKQA